MKANALTDYLRFGDARSAWDRLEEQIPSSTHATLYHYTSLTSFTSVVTSGVFWASDSRYLNDTSEGQYARTLISSVANEVAAHEDASTAHYIGHVASQVCAEAAEASAFFVSFSEEPDSLPQWVAYTPSTAGVCIGVDGSYLSGHELFALRKVVYDRAVQRAVLLDILSSYASSIHDLRDYPDRHAFDRALYVTMTLLMICAVCFKDPSFAAEKEWRAILVHHPTTPTQAVTWLSAITPKVRYRVSEHALVPFVELVLRSGGDWPVPDIVVGPGLDFALNGRSIVAYLQENNLTSRVHATVVPYRSVR